MIHYGNTRPNPLESKVWLTPKGELKTYNSHTKQWGNTSSSSTDNEKPSEPKQIEFIIEGVGTCKGMSNMTWREWCNSEYNEYTYDRVEAGIATHDIYNGFSLETSGKESVMVEVYEFDMFMPPNCIDSYNLSLNGVELNLDDVLVEGAVYERYVSQKITFYVDGVDHPYYAEKEWTFDDFLNSSEYNVDTWYWDGMGIVTGESDGWIPQTFYLVNKNEEFINKNDKIIANETYYSRIA